MSEHLVKENKITVLAFFVDHQWIAHVVRVMLLGKGFHSGLELFVTGTKRIDHVSANYIDLYFH